MLCYSVHAHTHLSVRPVLLCSVCTLSTLSLSLHFHKHPHGTLSYRRSKGHRQRERKGWVNESSLSLQKPQSRLSNASITTLTMKITRNTDLPSILSSKPLNPSPDSDLFHKSKSQRPPRRKSRSPGCSAAGLRLKRDVAPAARRSRPETPLLRWKFHDEAKEQKPPPELGRKSRRKERGRGKEVVVSSRKLAAVLWRLQLPEVTPAVLPKKDQLGFQYRANHNSRGHSYDTKDMMQSPRSVTGPRNGHLCKFEPSFQFSNSAMEGATKWDPKCLKTSDEVNQVYGSKHLDQQINAISAISAMEVELEQARARIHGLETEKQSSKKKLEHFLRKLSEERATWRSREHEKVRAIIDDVKSDLNRERKNRQRLEIVNSKLVNELSDAKLLAKRYLQDYEKERKSRELIEEVCDELAKEIGEDKAEAEALKRESMKFRDEVEEERKMLQMAEVWREERVQMKLIDAKVMVEEKYSQMNKLVSDLQTFLRSRSAAPDMEEMRTAEFLQQAAASVNFQDINEFKYEPPNPDIFSVFEDINFGEANERDIEPCVGYSPASHALKVHAVSPEVNAFNKDGMLMHSNAYFDQNGDIEEDGSGWETVSHLEDQASSYSPEGSDPSVNKIRRDSNMSGSGTEFEENACSETPITEISEVCDAPKTHLKKVSSISRFLRSGPNIGENFKIMSVEGMNGRLSNGRLSNGAIISPDRGSGGQWSSPESGNPHITRGMKGCIEWPRGMQKSSLKSKLLEARMESQKIQLRQVLKQKI
ncbi:Uncharacterized protein LOK49_LG07G03373 [Camellia lanceoleosa]|uniref:Uncharacterized protein n=1 Tax=Camellia lanceoleosa TaxID=1840588 RepID=A0ACC0HAW6_9ERIC|nr:Uncharacterized protein LOK49_LG07G03373 [Camellia lanceoleosa]